MIRLRAGLIGLAALMAGEGCVYYNSMWSAERLAKEAQRQETEGQVAMAKLTWARAAVKAESIVIRHPRSRWADDALVLQIEGLANSGNCMAIDEPMARAEASVSDDALHERVALAGAHCALAQGHPGAVPALLHDVVTSKDADRRSVAFCLLGQSAAARADWEQAIDAFSRSKEPNAAMGRARALLAAGRIPEARVFLDTLAGRHFDDSLWAATLSDIARAAGDSVASLALDSLLARSRMPLGSKARLLLADGDRLRRAGRHGPAGARYDLVLRLVPDSVEGAQAEVRALLAAAGAAPGIADLTPIASRVDQIVSRGAGPSQHEAEVAQRVLGEVRSPENTDIGYFRAGEIARDTLVAPALAAAWFGRIPQQFPNSLFAPKALIALAMLSPGTSDSVLAVLDSTFPASPYTMALRGDVSPAYQALEDSLGEALGLTKLGVPALFAQGIGTAVPGQKGPQLDPADAAVAARPVAGRPAPAPAGRRPAPVRPTPGQPTRLPSPDAADRP